MAVSEQDILYLSAQLESRLGDIQRENAMLIDKLSDYKSAQRDALRINRQLYRRLMQYSPHVGVDLHRNGGAIDKPHGASLRRPGGGRGRRGGSVSASRRPRGGSNPQQRPVDSIPMEEDEIDDLCESPNTLAARRRMLAEQRQNIRQQKKPPQPQPQQQIIVMQQKQTGSMRQVAPIRVCHSKVEPQVRAVPVVSVPKVETASIQQRHIISRPKVEPKVEEEQLDVQDSPPDIPAQQPKHEQLVPQQDVKTIVRAIAPQARPPAVSTQSSAPQVIVQVAQSSSQPQTSQSSQTAKQRLEAAFKAFAKQTGPAIQQEFLALGNATLNQRTLALELVSRWGKLADEERKSYFAST